MNPEEGELRPQLLDRFGLCVEVKGLTDPEQRADVVERQLQEEATPHFRYFVEHLSAAEQQGYGTDFPWAMGMGAANDEALMAVMGRAIATEARALGVNWLFNPVIDLNYNFDNPITNIRSLGDNPTQVSRLATVCHS